MFAYIKGTLEYKHNDYIIVETSGVGYKIHTALSTIESIGEIGAEVKVLTYLHTRPEFINLYGFLTHEELIMFELLIGVSGVGPKAAISLISSMSPSKFSLAVVTDDAKTLTMAQGIGKKTSQRIILELKDKIKKEQLAMKREDMETVPEGREDSKIAEAISALMVLGYTALEASKAVSAVYSEEMDLESIIKSSLRGMAIKK